MNRKKAWILFHIITEVIWNADRYNKNRKWWQMQRNKLIDQMTDKVYQTRKTSKIMLCLTLTSGSMLHSEGNSKWDERKWVQHFEDTYVCKVCEIWIESSMIEVESIAGKRQRSNRFQVCQNYRCTCTWINMWPQHGLGI